MKRLLILRHAKAVAAGPRVDDHARVLAPRGRNDAARMGAYMADNGLIPDLVLCSTSKRTLETWNEAARSWNPEPAVDFLDALYLAPWPLMLTVARGAPDEASSLLLVGHNPGSEALAAALIRKDGTKAERKMTAVMAEKFPTGALAIVTFEARHWKAIAPETGVLAGFVRPRDLDMDD